MTLTPTLSARRKPPPSNTLRIIESFNSGVLRRQFTADPTKGSTTKGGARCCDSAVWRCCARPYGSPVSLSIAAKQRARGSWRMMKWPVSGALRIHLALAGNGHRVARMALCVPHITALGYATLEEYQQ